jgi:hypothetical protein
MSDLKLNDSTNERLARLETRMELLVEMLKEIKLDLKNSPSREEHETLTDRVVVLENNASGLMLKVGVASGILTVLVNLLVRHLPL